MKDLDPKHWWAPVGLVAITAVLVMDLPRKALFQGERRGAAGQASPEAFAAFVSLDEHARREAMASARAAWRMRAETDGGGVRFTQTSDELPPPPPQPATLERHCAMRTRTQAGLTDWSAFAPPSVAAGEVKDLPPEGDARMRDKEADTPFPRTLMLDIEGITL